MPILNYTTQISTDKTVGEIHKMLAGARAQAILTEYDPHGIPCAISFRVIGPHGTMSFRLPANVPNILTVISRSNKVPVRLRTKEQAARVAWRIIKDWLAAQLAIIHAEMVTMEHVFLPYMQDSTGQTAYDSMQKIKFAGWTLESQSKLISG